MVAICDHLAAAQALRYPWNSEAIRYLGSMLAAEGFGVSFAYDGPSGLAKARKTKPDLMVLNYMMPGMNGDVVARRLRADKKNSGIRIIATSGYPIVRERFLQAGADEFLEMPFTPKQLLDAVERLLRRH